MNYINKFFESRTAWVINLLFFNFSQTSDDHPKNGRSEKRISTGSKPHSDLVKWQGTPIRTPLLRLPPDLSPLALECFDCILRYCGYVQVSLLFPLCIWLCEKKIKITYICPMTRLHFYFYSSDLPPDPELTEVKCVYTVLMVSYLALQ